jgi:hypothetical protein
MDVKPTYLAFFTHPCRLYTVVIPKAALKLSDRDDFDARDLGSDASQRPAEDASGLVLPTH